MIRPITAAQPSPDDQPEVPSWREREEQLERVRSTVDKLAAGLTRRRGAKLMAIAMLALITTPARAELQACFTPGEDCAGLIVQEIEAAKREILVQSYSFTSAPIAKALSDAKARGVDVRAILDKSNETAKYSGATFLAHADIPVLIDDKVAIAHNKLILIDRETTIGGSFNHTKAAQEKNAENVIVMRREPMITAQYVENWHRREALSRTYAGS